MTRQQAVAELAQPTYDLKLQREDKIYVAKKLGFTDSEFEDLLNLPNRSHDEFATDTKWRQRYFGFMRSVNPITSRLNQLRKRM
jgi:hypothetical protein